MIYYLFSNCEALTFEQIKRLIENEFETYAFEPDTGTAQNLLDASEGFKFHIKVDESEFVLLNAINN